MADSRYAGRRETDPRSKVPESRTASGWQGVGRVPDQPGMRSPAARDAAERAEEAQVAEVLARADRVLAEAREAAERHERTIAELKRKLADALTRIERAERELKAERTRSERFERELADAQDEARRERLAREQVEQQLGAERERADRARQEAERHERELAEERARAERAEAELSAERSRSADLGRQLDDARMLASGEGLAREQAEQALAAARGQASREITQQAWERRDRDLARARRGRLDRGTRETALLRDLGAFRTVALKDVVQERFGGNHFAARRSVDALKRGGLVHEDEALGPRGGKFRVLSLTSKGEDLVREGHDGDPDQRWWHGRVQKTQAPHDADVFRASMAAARDLLGEGRHVLRVVTEAELKSELARRTESARAQGGKAAADAERERVARDLDLPLADGKVQIPDARLEWADAQGHRGRVDIEVASQHYREAAVKGKQAAGFQVYEGGGRNAARRGLASLDSGSSGGRRFRRDEEWFSF